MPETIGAKCFGCGLVIKVPPSLGGRTAKCPKCAYVITIPTPADSQMDIVTDDQLPEVATGAIEEGELVEEAPEPKPDEGSRRKFLGKPSSHRLPAVRPGTSRRGEERGRRPGPPAPGSNTGLIVGGVVGGVILLVILAIALSGGSKSEGAKHSGDADKKETPVDKGPSPEELSLRNRLSDFVRAVNKGDIEKILEFYVIEEGKSMKIRSLYGDPEPHYDRVQVTGVSVSGETATTTFTCDLKTRSFSGAESETKGKEFTHSWKMVGGDWKIVP